MRTICKLGPLGVWTGESRDIEDHEGRPAGWVPTAPPEIGPGDFAIWTGSGWTVTDTAPQLPEPELGVPEAVSMRQARLALLGAGVLSQVDGAIDNLPEPDRTAAQIEWEYATELRRDHPLVGMLGAALDLDEAAIDVLFVAAAQIE